MIIEQVYNYIAPQFQDEPTGHDIHHIERVWRMAKHLHKTEGGDLEIIELSALLHDISDYKLNGGKLDQGGLVATSILQKFNYDEEKTKKIAFIVDHISYKGANTEIIKLPLEGEIVQDADRLDAIGAIGIARTFAYGGNKGQLIYSPELEPSLHNNFEEYANSKSTTINHFYEKLLLLVNRLNTKTAKEIGKKRHELMESYLSEFYSEWNFNKP